MVTVFINNICSLFIYHCGNVRKDSGHVVFSAKMRNALIGRSRKVFCFDQSASFRIFDSAFYLAHSAFRNSAFYTHPGFATRCVRVDNVAVFSVAYIQNVPLSTYGIVKFDRVYLSKFTTATPVLHAIAHLSCYYSASYQHSLLCRLQSAVLAILNPSAGPSVHLSDTLRLAVAVRTAQCALPLNVRMRPLANNDILNNHSNIVNRYKCPDRHEYSCLLSSMVFATV